METLKNNNEYMTVINGADVAEIEEDETEEENACGKHHNNGEDESECLECQIIKQNL